MRAERPIGEGLDPVEVCGLAAALLKPSESLVHPRERALRLVPLPEIPANAYARFVARPEDVLADGSQRSGAAPGGG